MDSHAENLRGTFLQAKIRPVEQDSVINQMFHEPKLRSDKIAGGDAAPAVVDKNILTGGQRDKPPRQPLGHIRRISGCGLRGNGLNDCQKILGTMIDLVDQHLFALFRLFEMGHILDRCEKQVVRFREKLQLYGYIIFGAVPAAVFGFQLQAFHLARQQGFDECAKILLADVGLQIPRGHFPQFVDRVSEVFAGSPIHGFEQIGLFRKEIGFADRFFDNLAEPLIQ